LKSLPLTACDHYSFAGSSQTSANDVMVGVAARAKDIITLTTSKLFRLGLFPVVNFSFINNKLKNAYQNH
jgi:hypothetical protein